MTGTDARLAIPAACGWVATAVVIGFPQAAIPALVVAWIAGGALGPLLHLRGAALG